MNPPSKGDVLGNLAGFAGKALLAGWLGSLTTKAVFLELIAKQMYEDDMNGPWKDAAEDKKRRFRDLARSAMLALRNLIMGRASVEGK